MPPLVIFALILLFCSEALAGHRAPSFVPRNPVTHRIERSQTVTRDFEKTHPCPANGHSSGACPGYVKDHTVALCKGGPDSVSNLEWQTTSAGKAKDKWECK